MCIAVLAMSASTTCFAQEKDRDKEQLKGKGEKSICENLVATAKRHRDAVCQSPRSKRCANANAALVEVCNECARYCKRTGDE
jgi:hypothetical protein